ncbi:MAG: uracil-DNA glycosylase [Acidimicrobiia bacterium]
MASVEQQHELHGGRSPSSLEELETLLVACTACPRLVEWREEVAVTKRAAFADETYWGKPVPGFGDPSAQIVIVGLAPGAHGSNRTGRMFTGDRSGDWLFAALHRAGLGSQPESSMKDDGLVLSNAFVTAPVHCVPPENKPTADERNNCASWFDAELNLLTDARVFVTLGQIGYTALWSHFKRMRVAVPVPRPKFAHGAEVHLDEYSIVMSYHVSQQNTFTGKLTEQMLDDVFGRAIASVSSG